jgi:hypothetical protein
MIRRFTTLFLTVILLSSTLFGQIKVTLKLEPYGVTPFMVAASTTDMYDFAYTGLKNVGLGTKTYLIATVNGKKFGTVTYAFLRRPGGSAAIINATKDIKNDSIQVVFFTPDKLGIYEITVTDGIYSASIVMNAAKYLGYTNTMVNGVDTKVSCKTCHAAYVTGWEKTNHATLFSRAMVATPGISSTADHYSISCVKCHTTGYDANPTALNDGFDDHGWVYPTVVTSASYSELVAKYPEAMKRGNIQCESCHGPAGGHLGVTSENRIEASFEPEVCAYCHESGTNHIIAQQFRYAHHGAPVDESNRTDCVRCHTGKGFAQWSEGMSVNDPYFDISFSAISCAACHDPHSKTNVHQFRKVDANLLATGGTTVKVDEAIAGNGAICFNCHQSRTEANAALTGVGTSTINSRFGPHHGPQGDILLGNNMLELGGVKLAKTNHIGYTPDACVTCHMYNMNRIDANKQLIQSGGHTFAVKSDKGEDNMEACQQCHGGTFASFADAKLYISNKGDHDNDGVVEGLQDEVKGMIAKIMAKMPKTSTGAITPGATWKKEELAAYWNALTAQEDKSNGIHNPKYVITALKGAMASMGIAVGIADEERSVPTTYMLYQNYPNPFNPTTNIKFSLPKSGDVKLVVYDAVGKEVATLVNNNLAAGTHTIQFNASGLASGVYLYRIEARDFVKVNKMLLIK